MNVCDGCLPRRDKSGVKHRSRAEHRCSGLGCGCGSCYPTGPVTQDQYDSWMAKLGGFYIHNTKALVEIVKEKVVKKE
jgi:hypothetical protein